VEASSLPDFGQAFRKLWEQLFCSAWHITLKLVDELKGLIKFLKICFVLVSSLMEQNGKTVYPSLNSLTTIATKLAFRWPPLKPYMVAVVEPLSTGPRLEIAKFLDLTIFEKLKNKSN
jgi:hypothetical protein